MDTASTRAAELELFRDNLKKFLAAEIAPHYGQWEKDGIIPKQAWLKLGEQGFLCVDTPEEFGGIGAPFEFSCAVLEEVSRAGFGALGANLAVHSDIVAPYIAHLGTPEQKAQYLPRMVTGECVGAIAMTEPGAGSDLQGAKTTAVAEGDHYVINGQKTFITNGQHAGVVITFTKTDPKAGAKGTTLFLVDTATPGFARGRNLEKIGHHCGDTSELFFDNVRVPKTALLGAAGNGFGHLMDELPRERLTLAVGALGAIEGMLGLTIDYVKQRKAFGNPIASLQNTRFEIADMQTQAEMLRAYVEQCAVAYAAGTMSIPLGAKVKLAATELQCRVADRCLQLFGGYGYMTEYPISRHFVDARIQRIYGGTSEIMKEVIARSLLGR